jgi:Ca-activated chloride channel family protein
MIFRFATIPMPTFAHPACLLLALAVPPLVYIWLRRRPAAVRYPDIRLLTALPKGRAWMARSAGALLRGAIVLALIVALAGPRWPDLRTRIATEGIAIEMLVDVSGSMAEQDFQWDDAPIARLEAVKRAFHLFVAGGADPAGEMLPGRPDDVIGLVAFATRPASVCPLTLSHAVLLKMLDEQQPRSVPGESETNISDAIALGLHRLQTAGPRKRVLLLLSDGEHNVAQTQSNWTPRQAAQVAANLGVPIYAIDAGGKTNSERERTPVSAAQRTEGIRTLQEVARISKGHYFQARDTAALLDVCRRIDRLERSEIESFQYRRYHEAYPWFGLASFVFFIGLFVLERTIWQRVP